MRMIDFRAWDKKESEILDVMDIDFSGNKVGVCNVPKKMFKDGRLHTIYSIERDWNEVELMQSTGLKDKNGVEIYEGDVVNITQYFGGHPYGEMKHIIKRSKYNNDLVADSESGDWRTPEVSMSFRKSDDYEVIGNIYENPELLEEEE